MYIMDNGIMYKYQEYLLKACGEDEKERQRDLRYCDGSLQTYLEYKWIHEDVDTKKYIGFLVLFK